MTSLKGRIYRIVVGVKNKIKNFFRTEIVLRFLLFRAYVRILKEYPNGWERKLEASRVEEEYEKVKNQENERLQTVSKLFSIFFVFDEALIGLSLSNEEEREDVRAISNEIIKIILTLIANLESMDVDFPKKVKDDVEFARDNDIGPEEVEKFLRLFKKKCKKIFPAVDSANWKAKKNYWS